MLTRLIYASEAAAALNPESVQALLEQARAANQQREITGLLAFDSQVFMQVLEGPREQVSALFLRIAADRRHKRVVVLDARSVDERHFGAWSMAFAADD